MTREDNSQLRAKLNSYGTAIEKIKVETRQPKTYSDYKNIEKENHL